MKKLLVRSAALMLALLMLLPLAACANTGKSLLTLEANGKTYQFSVNLYELMLSATKGTMVSLGVTSNGLKPSANAYWDIVEKQSDGSLKTLNEIHSAEVLENCRTYLIALALFDEYGLTLSETAKQKIEDDLNELVLTDGDGSKTKLNSLLSNFGVNYDMMKEYYTIKAKIDALESHIYSTIGEKTKEDFLKEHYIHFQQIFIAKYEYVYVTDENDDVIYYDPSDDSVCYKRTEFTKTNNKGELVYYTDDTYTHISYDTEKGVPANKLKADGSGYEVKYLEDEDLLQVENRADLLCSLMQGTTKQEFEAAASKESDDAETAAAFTDGYYLLKSPDYASSGEEFAYLDTIIQKFETLEAGAVTMVESTMGYHILMKYDHTEKAYDKEENQGFFKDFPLALTKEIFDIRCKPYYGAVKMDEAVYAEAPDMKKVAVNYFYY